LWRVPPDSPAEIWIKGVLLEGTGDTPGYPPIGVNGVGWFQDNLYVTNHEKGYVLRIPILQDGTAGTPEIIVEGMYSLDGLTLDNEENIYVAFGTKSQIVMVNPLDGEVTTLAARENGLDVPSSLVFGMRAEDQQILYFTNYAVLGGGQGPGILKLDTAGDQ
jgi:sugar lactone lactonase YvrE